jgi:DNA mismatch repair protein MLH1
LQKEIITFKNVALPPLLSHGANRAGVHSASTSSRIYGIRNVYEACVICDLMEIEVSDDNVVDEIFRMDGSISNPNYVANKTTMIISS